MAFFPIIVLPLAVIALVISKFGFTLASFTAILILGQVYFIWAQLEVSLRQTEVGVLQFEPQLKLKVEQKTGALATGDQAINKTGYHLQLSNDGAVSYNVIVSPEVIPKPSTSTESKILSSLGHGETIEVYSFGKGFVKSTVSKLIIRT